MRVRVSYCFFCKGIQLLRSVLFRSNEAFEHTRETAIMEGESNSYLFHVSNDTAGPCAKLKLLASPNNCGGWVKQINKESMIYVLNIDTRYVSGPYFAERKGWKIYEDFMFNRFPCQVILLCFTFLGYML